MSEGGGTPSAGSGNDDSFGSKDEHIDKGLHAMAYTLKTVKEFLNFFVKELWDKIVKKEYISLKTHALDTLGPDNTQDKPSQGWTINRLLNKIVRLCKVYDAILDLMFGML